MLEKSLYGIYVGVYGNFKVYLVMLFMHSLSISFHHSCHLQVSTTIRK